VTHWLHRHHHRHHRHVRVVLNLGGTFAVELKPKETIHAMTTLNVGQTSHNTLEFLDNAGNVISATPDSPPQWTGSDSAVETLTVAADGLSADAAAIAAGTDQISVTVSVGGQSFSADVTDTVSVPVASVRIAQTVA
jgi:hypothetical protein